MKVPMIALVATLAIVASTACSDDDGAKTPPAGGSTVTASATATGTGSVPATVQATPATPATARPVQAPTYQAEYSYLVKASGFEGTMVLAQQPPQRAWWVTLNKSTTGWVTDGTHTVTCVGPVGGPMSCEPAQVSGSGSGLTSPSDSVNQASLPGVKVLEPRTIAGQSGQCWEVPGAEPSTMCATADGILLLLDNAQTRIEATKVTGTPDPALFKTN